MYPGTSNAHRMGFILLFRCVCCHRSRGNLSEISHEFAQKPRTRKISFTISPEENRTRLNLPLFRNDSHVLRPLMISLTEVKKFVSKALVKKKVTF